MAAWMPVPDKLDEAEGDTQRFRVCGTTLVAFFLAEVGDKAQVATVAVAARYSDLLAVVAGTALGMRIANVAAVRLGDVVANKVPRALVHAIAALIPGVLGVPAPCSAGRLS
jgi:Ca2+/H+ antiporter, TMEM165/GDT1 family